MSQSTKKKTRKGYASMVWYRFRKNKLAILGLLILLTMAFMCLFANLFVDYQTDVVEQHAMERLQLPSAGHIMGTDTYGRDIFARVLYGGRTSLSIGLFVVCLALLAGGTIGAVAAYCGGKVDMVLMRIMDVLLAIPSLVLAMAVVSAIGTSITNLMLALAIARTPQFARIVRASVMPLKNQEYVEAARACGTKSSRIILKHILPNAFGPIIVQATLQIGSAILNISSLSFIGLGIQPPAPEWGSMLSELREYLRHKPILMLGPGIAIMLAVFSFNRIGDGLRDALDPRLKN